MGVVKQDKWLIIDGIDGSFAAPTFCASNESHSHIPKVVEALFTSSILSIASCPNLLYYPLDKSQYLSQGLKILVLNPMKSGSKLMVYSIWALVWFITSLDLFEPGSASLLMEPITLFFLNNRVIPYSYFFFFGIEKCKSMF